MEPAGITSPDSPLPMVLVVDDEPTMRALMIRTLRPHYHVLAASDGQQALELVWGMAGDIRVVVTDVKMPRLDGVGLAKEIGKLAKAPALLFISGYAGVEEVPGPYLPKPFSPEALLLAVSRLLGRTGQQ